MNNNVNKKTITFGVVLMVVGISLLCLDYFNSKKNKVFEDMNMELFAIDEVEQKEEINDENGELPEEEVKKESQIDIEHIGKGHYYIARLEIPKIKLRKGLVDINSKNNTVKKNVAIMPTSKFPDVDKSNLILAAHTGNSFRSFFTELRQLKGGDKVYLYYDSVKYTYEIAKIYDQEKTGTVNIYRDYDKTTITLVTCKMGDDHTQTVYIGYLKDKDKI